jgi:hypothetical protein
MPLTTEAAAALCALIFENSDWANIGDAAGIQNSATTGSFWFSLHTASPTAAGTQTSSEVTFTGYARVAVARNTGFTTTSNASTNAAEVLFGECDGTGATVTHIGVGTDETGAGHLVMYAALTESRAVADGIALRFPAGDLDFTVPTT